MRSGHGKSIATPFSKGGGNQPHRGHGEHGPIRKGLMGGFSQAGAHMPLRKPSGGDRKAKTSPVARNGSLAGGKLKSSGTSDTRRRSGAEGNGKGTVATGKKGASTREFKGTAGRGGAGAMHSNRLSESPSHDWFEKLGC
jgi:hypothetical protein